MHRWTSRFFTFFHPCLGAQVSKSCWQHSSPTSLRASSKPGAASKPARFNRNTLAWTGAQQFPHPSCTLISRQALPKIAPTSFDGFGLGSNNHARRTQLHTPQSSFSSWPHQFTVLALVGGAKHPNCLPHLFFTLTFSSHTPFPHTHLFFTHTR